MSDVRVARKRPASVLVWEWKGQSDEHWPEWLAPAVERHREQSLLYLKGHSDRPAQLGDFIINQDGDVYPVGRDAFQRTYEYL